VAGDFVFTPFGNHEIQASTGYGSVAPRTAPFAGTGRWQDRGVGAIEVKDRWQIAEKLAATLGGRYTYVGFLPSANHLDPSAALELQRDETTRFRTSVSRRTLVPGGDVLTLNGMSSTSAVALAVMDEGLRPERVMRYEVALGQDLGSVTVEARTFYEGVRDQLVQRFEPEGGLVHVSNGGRVAARGMGLSVARRFGDVVHGQVSYTFGHGWRPGGAVVEGLAWHEGDFHDLSARLETVIEETDTRVIALWRVNRLDADPSARSAATLAPGANQTNTRFDVQLSQGLPFLGSLTRADWDVLVAVKNVYYGDAEGGGVLDEIAVVNPPKRVLGGISVRF
jgi:outer membrane receptor protein involved in Fe transport